MTAATAAHPEIPAWLARWVRHHLGAVRSVETIEDVPLLLDFSNVVETELAADQAEMDLRDRQGKEILRWGVSG